MKVIKKREIKEINELQIKTAIKAYYAKRGYGVNKIRLVINEGHIIARISFHTGPYGLNVVELNESAINLILKGDK